MGTRMGKMWRMGKRERLAGNGGENFKGRRRERGMVKKVRGNKRGKGD